MLISKNWHGYQENSIKNISPDLTNEPLQLLFFGINFQNTQGKWNLITKSITKSGSSVLKHLCFSLQMKNIANTSTNITSSMTVRRHAYGRLNFLGSKLIWRNSSTAQHVNSEFPTFLSFIILSSSQKARKFVNL